MPSKLKLTNLFIMENKVKKIQFLSITRDKRTKRATCLHGLIIEGETESIINNKSILEVSFKGNKYLFIVREFECAGQTIYYKATEYGYGNDKLSKIDDLDIRQVIGCNVCIVTDKKRITKINERSLWT